MRLAAESSGVVECSGGESTTAAGEVGGGGAVVVVGVEVDSRSKELLTWALLKVAQSGDRIIALHVLDPNVGEEFYTAVAAHYCTVWSNAISALIISPSQ